jgi:hypothetical protein
MFVAAAGGLMATAFLLSCKDFGVAETPVSVRPYAAGATFALSMDRLLNRLTSFFGWVSDHIGRTPCSLHSR